MLGLCRHHYTYFYLFYYNYPGGSGLMAGAVFGRIAGDSAAVDVLDA